jgi:hypothetical protein
LYGYPVREIRRRAATRLASLTDQTMAFQGAAIGAYCGFRMASFTNMRADSQEIVP